MNLFANIIIYLEAASVSTFHICKEGRTMSDEEINTILNLLTEPEKKQLISMIKSLLRNHEPVAPDQEIVSATD